MDLHSEPEIDSEALDAADAGSDDDGGCHGGSDSQSDGNDDDGNVLYESREALTGLAIEGWDDFHTSDTTGYRCSVVGAAEIDPGVATNCVDDSFRPYDTSTLQPAREADDSSVIGGMQPADSAVAADMGVCGYADAGTQTQTPTRMRARTQTHRQAGRQAGRQTHARTRTRTRTHTHTHAHTHRERE